MQKKYTILILGIYSAAYTADIPTIDQQAPAIERREPVEPQHHEMILLKKITNASKQPIFVAFEDAMLTPLQESITISGSIMSGSSLESKDPEGSPQTALIPAWQRSFRGNTINIISLAGSPGRNYYLYVLDSGDLWGIIAPNKPGELKGVHLLPPSDKMRTVEIIVKDNNVLEAHVLAESEHEVRKVNRAPTSDKAHPQYTAGEALL